MNSTASRPYSMTQRAAAANATAERILDAAVETFMESFDLPLREVARRAGVTEQTVIRRFGGKQQLLELADARQRGSLRVAARNNRPRPRLPRAVVLKGVRRRVARSARREASASARATDRDHRRLHMEAAATRPPAQSQPNRGRNAGTRGIDRWRCLMARILAYTSPARGHVYPVTPILDELRRRGHEIVLRTLGSEVEMLRERGLDAGPIAAAVEAIEMNDWRAKNPRDALARSVMTFAGRAKHDAPDLAHAITEVRPDAVLVDINCWGAMAAAQKWGGPWAAFCPYPLPLESRDAPPFGPGLTPARGPAGRLRDRLIRPQVIGTLEKKMLPPFNAVRHDVGVPALDSASEIFLQAPLLIYMTAEPFEYPRRDWPQSIAMVGPCEWEPPAELPAWVGELNRPVVLVTTSSEFQDDGKLAQTAMDALAGEPLDVIVTLPAGDPGAYDVPANARVERFIPHGPVLDRAVCAVTHGGMGATQKALARGVPVCAVPFGRDQLEVARRVAVSGAGTRLPARRLSAGRLRAKVRKAIEMREGAAKVKAAFRAAGGAPAAADALEVGLLGDRTHANSAPGRATA
ncbi:MAG: TetR family transcriptional regulator [Actinobacteria bacterium]|nr:TetR family transcriptional regulator [Actinomycetota bacterium]